jgi:hypothetical protein
LVETTAVLFWLHKKSCEFLEKPDEDSYDEFLMKGMLGSKDSTGKLQAYNVLTAVEHLDKEFTGVKQLYERLCEFTHPNWSGVMGSYSKHNDKSTLYLGKEHADPPLTFGLVPLIASLVISQDRYNGLGDVLLAINDRYNQR